MLEVSLDDYDSRGFGRVLKLTLGSGASTTLAGLPRRGPRSALGSVMAADFRLLN
jgi:hypothetical protein